MSSSQSLPHSVSQLPMPPLASSNASSYAPSASRSPTSKIATASASIAVRITSTSCRVASLMAVTRSVTRRRCCDWCVFVDSCSPTTWPMRSSRCARIPARPPPSRACGLRPRLALASPLRSRGTGARRSPRAPRPSTAPRAPARTPARCRAGAARCSHRPRPWPGRSPTDPRSSPGARPGAAPGRRRSGADRVGRGTGRLGHELRAPASRPRDPAPPRPGPPTGGARPPASRWTPSCAFSRALASVAPWAMTRSASSSVLRLRCGLVDRPAQRFLEGLAGHLASRHGVDGVDRALGGRALLLDRGLARRRAGVGHRRLGRWMGPLLGARDRRRPARPAPPPPPPTAPQAASAAFRSRACLPGRRSSPRRTSGAGGASRCAAASGAAAGTSLGRSERGRARARPPRRAVVDCPGSGRLTSDRLRHPWRRARDQLGRSDDRGRGLGTAYGFRRASARPAEPSSAPGVTGRPPSPAARAKSREVPRLPSRCCRSAGAGTRRSATGGRDAPDHRRPRSGARALDALPCDRHGRQEPPSWPPLTAAAFVAAASTRLLPRVGLLGSPSRRSPDGATGSTRSA